jgi:hypothetical protein
METFFFLSLKFWYFLFIYLITFWVEIFHKRCFVVVFDGWMCELKKSSKFLFVLIIDIYEFIFPCGP